MQINDRLRLVREEMKLSQAKFASKFGLAQSTYAQYEKGGRSVPDDLKVLLNQLGVNMNWLISGEGPMYLGEGQEAVYKLPSGREITVNGEASYSVPILASSVSAGNGQEWQPSDYSGESLPTLEKFFLGYPKEDIFAAKVVGDSMIGIDLLPGDYVYACHNRIEGNGLYVLVLDNETYVKRLEIDKIDRKIRIISENDHYPDKVVDPERVIILGKVIGWLHRTPY